MSKMELASRIARALGARAYYDGHGVLQIRPIPKPTDG